jgi:hypothetical protein
MQGLKILFDTKDNISIDPNASLSDFDATIQNALVNIGTRNGTDRIYPDKGTTILTEATSGKIVGFNAANHVSQLAALDTLFFSREYETSETLTVRLGSVAMEPVTYDGSKLKLQVAFTDQANSRTVGTITNL